MLYSLSLKISPFDFAISTSKYRHLLNLFTRESIAFPLLMYDLVILPTRSPSISTVKSVSLRSNLLIAPIILSSLLFTSTDPRTADDKLPYIPPAELYAKSTSGTAACAILRDSFSIRPTLSRNPTSRPSPVSLPISIRTREGDLTFNDFLIVLDTLFAMPLAVAITPPRREFNPDCRPAIA